ncbi:nuclear receptor-interacting protein 2 isoform X1 [Malaclemys terrapin pileata]|uniref:nuclear receptor-interacting protein 2 isoform X1 n=1 Tax=Malaclemys terrapin pileata TaxID=2991368 RepID=UPI0023A8BFF6|nr:nuclear receptor-interacting protein 2 isoform X1 [Malaclemys terrapin pileata]
MSTRETCAQEVGPGDGEEKRSEGTQNPDRRQREVELRDKAILQQKRRLKQATQFVHKDSADLLPLDGLKRLGTSKDLQPHSVVQRRLLEGNLNKLRGESREYTTWVQSPLVKDKDDRAEKKENDRRKETVSLLIHCKCQGQVLRAAVNTGCQQNLISMSCLKRLGLEEVSDAGNGDLSLPVPSVIGQVECVEVQLGQETVVCSALVVDDEMLEFCFGLQTLLTLKVRNGFPLIASEHNVGVVARLNETPSWGCRKHVMLMVKLARVLATLLSDL